MILRQYIFKWFQQTELSSWVFDKKLDKYILQQFILIEASTDSFENHSKSVPSQRRNLDFFLSVSQYSQGSEEFLRESFSNTLSFTVGKRNYFTGYGILLHEVPVVAMLFTQSDNNGIFHCPIIVFALGEQYSNYRTFVK